MGPPKCWAPGNCPVCPPPPPPLEPALVCPLIYICHPVIPRSSSSYSTFYFAVQNYLSQGVMSTNVGKIV